MSGYERCRHTPTSSLKAGDRHYRAFVGPPAGYDILAALQFNLLTTLGLRETHSVLDIGCGSLRAGRLLIPYLLPERYCGLEPEEWLLREGIENEVGNDLVRIKKPTFAHNPDFDLSAFGRRFDFILAQSIFSHATARQIATCFRHCAKCLNPSGLIAATFVLGGEDYTGSEWVYPGCVRYTEAGMRKMAADAGLCMRIIEWPHPEQNWMLLSHASRESSLPEPTGALARLDVAGVVVDQFVENADGWGYMDDQRTVDTRVFIRGWARNAETNRPIKDILIADQNRKIIASTVTWAPRQDVAELFKEPALANCGYVATFPKSLLHRGLNYLSVYAFLPQDRRAVQLQCNPAMTDVVIRVD